MDNLNLIEEGKIKRYFNLKYRIIYPEAIYHITQRAPGMEQIFLERADYLYMLHLLKEKSREFKLDVYAYAFLPNHIHLLLKITEPNLSKALKNIFETYAIYFNKKYQRKGHVFCGRFRASLCLDEAYFLVASLYIHLNPYKAGLAQEPDKYPWSSCSLYTQLGSKKSFIKTEIILNLLNEEENEAKKRYFELILEGMGLEMENIFENPKVVISLRNRLSKKIKDLARLIMKNDLFVDEDLKEEIQKFQKKKKIKTPEELNARKYLIKQLFNRGFSISEIAEKLGKTRQSIYYNLTK
ncbi:MAG: transposase [Candidatus Omnitrophica bacterium]|nr:transposase [Candidatus Omnitrophota bacterium]